MFQPLCPQASFRLHVGFLMPVFFVPYGEAGQHANIRILIYNS